METGLVEEKTGTGKKIQNLEKMIQLEETALQVLKNIAQTDRVKIPSKIRKAEVKRSRQFKRKCHIYRTLIH